MDKTTREKGRMGVGSINEFGNSDTELIQLHAKPSNVQHTALLARLKEVQTTGEIGAAVDIEIAAQFVETTMLGLQVAAKAGLSLQTLRKTASFAIAGQRSRWAARHTTQHRHQLLWTERPIMERVMNDEAPLNVTTGLKFIQNQRFEFGVAAVAGAAD